MENKETNNDQQVFEAKVVSQNQELQTGKKRQLDPKVIEGALNFGGTCVEAISTMRKSDNETKVEMETLRKDFAEFMCKFDKDKQTLQQRQKIIEMACERINSLSRSITELMKSKELSQDERYQLNEYNIQIKDLTNKLFEY